MILKVSAVVEEILNLLADCHNFSTVVMVQLKRPIIVLLEIALKSEVKLPSSIQQQ